MLGDLTLIPMLSFGAIGMIWWVTQELNVFYRSLNTIRSALQVLNTCSDPQIKSTLSLEYFKDYQIRLDNVCFDFRGKSLFKNLNLSIDAGSKVGIIGLSGSGKTTLQYLLTGIHEVSAGKIFIGQHDISHCSSEMLSRLISVVPQEPSLFNRSIMDNIQYGDLGANQESIIDAAKNALCHEFILNLVDGYDTIVGDRGITLSIGQRQRILIARALLAKTPIIILDEPTASLDALTENKLLCLLQNALSNCTVILVTHRHSTLTLVDRVWQFSNGQINESSVDRVQQAADSLLTV